MSKKLISKILFPTDGSEYSLKAAKYAVDIAKNNDAKVTIMHVYQTTPPPVYLEPATGGEYLFFLESEKTIKERGNLAIEKTKEIFNHESLSIETKFFQGHPVEAIVETAEKEKFDLIIIGSRGLGRLGRILLGSVAEGVIHNAPCPVLVIR
jgi:nucleotide-binding universal stress UspA family protein